MRAIRWSGENDRYFGPFTYAHEPRYKKLCVMLGSGDVDDYPGCRLRLAAGAHTLIVALPPLIKPWQRPGSGRWDRHEREYGFSFVDGALHLHYGEQTNQWPGAKSKVWFPPWREWRHVRHSLYDLGGKHFADMPEWGFRHPNDWAVKNAIEDACPVAQFEFADFDGERIVATTRIEERQWKRGVRWCKWLSLLWPDKVSRSLDLHFSAEVGKRKGSWKGGTIGHSIEMLPDELHEDAFRRYCPLNGLTFIGAVCDSRLKREPAKPRSGFDPKDESDGAAEERQSP